MLTILISSLSMKVCLCRCAVTNAVIEHLRHFIYIQHPWKNFPATKLKNCLNMANEKMSAIEWNLFSWMKLHTDRWVAGIKLCLEAFFDCVYNILW